MIAETQAPSMVERMARAYFARVSCWDEIDEAGKDDVRGIMRRVLEAMREPTQAMTDCGFLAIGEDLDTAAIWRAMVEEALRS